MQFYQSAYCWEFCETPKERPQFDVILRFEPQAEEYFNMLMEKIAQVTGNATRLDSGQPPHISLGIFDIVDGTDPVRVMEETMRRFRPFSVKFEVLGAFLPGALIAAPVMTDELIAANLAVQQAAEGFFVPLRQYVFGTWVPHVTLAAELTHLELVEAFDAAGLDWRPLTARTASVSLVHHLPYTEELVIPLE